MKAEGVNEFLEFIHIIRKYFRPEVKYCGIKGHEMMILGLIDEYMEENPDQPGVKVSTIAQLHGSAIPNISRKLRSIEEKGYIERILLDNDRRSVFLRITPKARGEINESMNEFGIKIQGIFKHLEEKDVKELNRLLRLVTNIMIEERKSLQE